VVADHRACNADVVGGEVFEVQRSHAAEPLANLHLHALRAEWNRHLGGDECYLDQEDPSVGVAFAQVAEGGPELARRAAPSHPL